MQSISTLDTMHENPIMVDVVIVGAGITGLRAANALQSLGYTFALLEATPRVGGRIQSTQASEQGGMVDLGAAWINDTTQKYIYELVQKFDLTTEQQYTDGLESWTFTGGAYDTSPYGELPSQDGSDVALRYFEHVQRTIARFNPDDPYLGDAARELDLKTAEEFAAECSTNSSLAFANEVICRSLLGAEPREISILYLLEYIRSGTGIENLISERKEGAQYVRIREGLSGVIRGLHAALPNESIYVSTPVTHISQDDESATTTTSTGLTFRSKKVILTIPTPYYRSIQFSPPLPAQKTAYFNAATQGSWNKTIFVFDSPWWREAGHMGAMHWQTGLAEAARDTSLPPVDDANDKNKSTEQYSLTCFITAQSGRDWSALPTSTRQPLVFKQVEDTFARFKDGVKVPKPINVIEKDWAKEPYINIGGPCPYVGPGILTRDEGSAKGTFDAWKNLHFAGTETADVWRGYMDGALRSADKAVREVDEAIGIERT